MIAFSTLPVCVCKPARLQWRESGQWKRPRHSLDGTLLGKILLPETAANLTFGGLNRNRLFITASASLYSLHVGVRGAAR